MQLDVWTKSHLAKRIGQVVDFIWLEGFLCWTCGGFECRWFFYFIARFECWPIAFHKILKALFLLGSFYYFGEKLKKSAFSATDDDDDDVDDDDDDDDRRRQTTTTTTTTADDDDVCTRLGHAKFGHREKSFSSQLMTIPIVLWSEELTESCSLLGRSLLDH